MSEQNENTGASEMQRPEAADSTGDERAAETPAERGEQIGEAVAAAAQREEHDAATPAGEAADRKTHRGVVIAVVAFAVLLIGAGIAYGALTPGAEDEVVSPRTTAAPNAESDSETDAEANDLTAPDFTMRDTSGETLTLADFRGKPVLLNFWASWCDPCLSEMPAIQAAYDQYGDQIQFVPVNMTGMGGETEASAQALIQQEGYTFPLYFDVDSSAAVAYGVTSIPQTYLIDAEGNIIASVRGAMSDAVLEEGIQILLGHTAS